jgi:hypothetical protein
MHRVAGLARYYRAMIRRIPASSSLFDSVNGLFSDEDVFELAKDLEPNSSAAFFGFEHGDGSHHLGNATRRLGLEVTAW